MIQIFTTGGTIDKVYFDAQSTYQVGDPQIAYILREAGITAPYRVTTLLRKDSLDLTDADRALVADHVRHADARRVLITHGTDTMVQTAQTLEGALNETEDSQAEDPQAEDPQAEDPQAEDSQAEDPQAEDAARRVRRRSCS